jgi:divalent metal cation (Fe/Co/Zn/Cd) transporter
MVRAITAWLEKQDEVLDVVDVLTMMTGVNRILLCARVDFIDGISATELERACVRFDAELRTKFSSLDEIFLQPVPRSDAELRVRVLTRYGRVLADEPESESAARARSLSAVQRGRGLGATRAPLE